MKKIFIWLISIAALVGGSWGIAYHFHLTPTTTLKLSRILVQELYNTHLTKQKNSLKNMPYSIVSDHVFLRKLEYQDFDSYQPIINNPYCSDIFFINNELNQVPEIDPYFYLYIQSIAQCCGSRTMYSIFDATTHTLLGMVEITAISNTEKDIFEITGFIRPKEWGTGKALEAAALAIDAFFKTTDAEELLAHTAPHNHRCHSFLVKCGFDFLHVSDEEISKNDSVFSLSRSKGLEVITVVHKLLHHQQAKKNYSKLP